VVDSVRSDLPQHLSGPAVNARARGGRATPPDASLSKLDKPAVARLHLQRSAPANLRHHVRRVVTRFVVLVAADMVTFALMRGLIRGARDGAMFGTRLASWVRAVLPGGYLNGWQFAVALFAGLVVTGNYGPGDQRRNAARLFAACALATALPLWTALWTRGPGVVLEQFVLTVGLVWVAIVIERLTIDRIKGWIRPPERDALDALFVGHGGACQTAMESPAFAASAEYRPIAFVDTHTPPAPGAVGHISEFSDLLAACGAHVVVVCGYLSDVQFQEVVDTALTAGCQVLSVPRTVQIAGVHPMTVWRRGQPLVELTTPSLKGWQLFLKRLLDVIGSTLGLVLLSPLFTLAGIAVKVASPGPVFFAQRRLGLNGRTFRCYKFRSMRADADGFLQSDPSMYAKYVANNYKLPEGHDPRLTRIGHFLRKTSLDELPQLINVFKGEMSLVGPRPIVPEELHKYGHGAGVFLSLKPGMTGAWQVNGRSTVGYPDRVDIELDYIRNWSLPSDVAILLRTIPALLKRRGAH